MTDPIDSSDLYAKHVKIQNRWVNGFYQNIRSVTIWFTLIAFFLTPWLRWHGRQAVLFDVGARKFYLFDITFWPQDFYLLLLLLLSSALALIVVTNLAGRVWCGYTCPQTVWTKCFMWIEYMTEGDRNKRLKRDKNPWETSTIVRRVLKHGLWLLLAMLTAMTFVGYFFPITSVVLWQVNSWGIFWIAFFTLATYLNAGWMREQVCLYICPYARFQGVMFDNNTLVISYDRERGEPRGSLKADAERKKTGSCIDCSLCVQVCPTGIDIRDGLQMACIGCAACVDACNSVMDKVHFPRGLIRYDTENRLIKRKVKIFRPRLVASIALLSVVASAFVYLLATRIPLQLNVAHDHRNLYRTTANGTIENSYVLSIDNMSQATQNLTITIQGIDQALYVGQKAVKLVSGESAVIPITITVPVSQVLSFDTPIEFIVQDTKNERLKAVGKSNFFSPH